jgi:hypothetical protein
LLQLRLRVIHHIVSERFLPLLLRHEAVDLLVWQTIGQRNFDQGT